jgi:hypothetical protein
MKTIALLFLSALLVSSCASSPVSSSKDHASADQKKYLERIRTFAHEFKVLNNSAEEMWGRAQVFVNKFSLMKIKAVSNYIIQTDDLIHVTTVADALAGNDLGFGYSFSRSPGKDSTTFTLKCMSNYGGSSIRECTEDNEHFASFYMQTGEDILYPQFIAQ